MRFWSLIPLLLLASALGAAAEQCGMQAGGAVCAGGLCCSQWGYCGSTSAYCDEGCQSQCAPSGGGPTLAPPPPTPMPTPTPSGGGGNISDLISRELFDEMLAYRNDDRCPAKGFYTYDAFIEAAKSFPAFGTTGDIETRKREIVAFLAQTSHETTGGWESAPGGPFAWGYCFVEEIGGGDYCVASQQWPCAPGKRYYGRGPIQISYNYNYGQAGEALHYDLLNNPDAVASDVLLSFKTALWFWMTPQPPKPSCHDVMIGQWQPSAADVAAGWVPGFGLTTNIINGGVECGYGTNPQMENRMGFYRTYCDKLNLDYGDNLDCYNQRPFG